MARFLPTEEKIALALLLKGIIGFKVFGYKSIARKAQALLFALRFVAAISRRKHPIAFTPNGQIALMWINSSFRLLIKFDKLPHLGGGS